tara:strand:+ start:1544 stop:2974 length:1431 start_codon:yes stop_codon:yes gene_type:complete
MSELRPLRLLNAVENGTVLGAELNTYLTDPGRLAEITVLFAQRGQAKRIANGQTTMTAITSSLIATNAAFVQATNSNDTIVAAVVESALAMSTVSDSSSVLTKVSDNPTSWGYFSGSIYYESHIKKIIAHLSGVDPSLYGSTSLLILDPVSMGDISVSERGMRALVQSLPSVTILAGDSTAMALVAADSTAISLIAQKTSIMSTIANNVEAMDEIVARSLATGIMASTPGAIQAIAANLTAWTNYLNGSYFSANIKNIVANLAGLNPGDFSNIAAIFENEAASLAVAGNAKAMQAILADTTSINALVSSSNLDTVLGSSIAMLEITGNISIMNTLISDTTAFPILLTSTAAKSAIFASPTLVATMMAAGSDSLATVQGSSQSATVVNDALIGTFKTVGVAGNIIILTGVMGSIVATTLDNTFKGDTQSPHVVALPGTSLSSGPVDINLPFTNAVWDINSIAATVAGNVTITYVDFN